MQKLFNMERNSNPGTQSVANWAYVKNALQTNLDKVVTYYQLAGTAVDASHILNRIITTIAFGNHYEPRLYEQLLDRSVTQYAGALGLTSSVSKGLLHNGEFFGKYSKEIIIAHNDENYRLADVVANWQDIEAVKVLHHPYTDLSMSIADGKSVSIESGLAVIAINFNLLGLQYKMFVDQENRLHKETGKARRTMQQFIRGYVLTNMLKSHLDYTIFNRLFANYKGVPTNVIRGRHPFGLIDVEQALNNVQQAQLKMISTSAYRFADILRTIPVVTESDLLELSKLPIMALTRQVLWGLVPSRLKMLSFVIGVSGPMGRALNSSEMERIKLTLRELNTSRVLRSALPTDLYFDATEELEKAMPGA